MNTQETDKQETAPEAPPTALTLPTGGTPWADAIDRAENRAYAGTPGALYVTGFLSAECEADASWLMEAVNSGDVIACPRCHFLHLPALPFPLENQAARLRGEDQADAPGRDACDVCAYVPNAATLPFDYDNMSKALAAAPAFLQDERDKRAEVLYALWMGRSNGSDALIWAAMAWAVTSAVEGAKAPETAAPMA